MKTRSLKSQIATTFIILLSLSMFMLSCVWVMLSKKGLIEKEIVLLENYADSLGEDLHREMGSDSNGTYLSFFGWPFFRISSRASSLGFISLYSDA
jgi:hypothetical protein